MMWLCIQHLRNLINTMWIFFFLNQTEAESRTRQWNYEKMLIKRCSVRKQEQLEIFERMDVSMSSFDPHCIYLS